jgi:hypothetical protein
MTYIVHAHAILGTGRKRLVQHLLCLIQLSQAHQRLGTSDIALKLHAGRRMLHELSTESNHLEAKVQARPGIKKLYADFIQLYTNRDILSATHSNLGEAPSYT